MTEKDARHCRGGGGGGGEGGGCAGHAAPHRETVISSLCEDRHELMSTLNDVLLNKLS